MFIKKEEKKENLEEISSEENYNTSATSINLKTKPLFIKKEEKKENHENDSSEENDNKSAKSIKLSVCFPCGYCGIIFETKPKLSEHIVHAHTHEYRFFCELCGRGYYYDSRRREHVNRSHNKLFKQPKKVKQDRFTCKPCNLKFHCNSFLQDHLSVVHTKQFRFFCDMCGMGFYLHSRKLLHIKIHHDPKRKDFLARLRLKRRESPAEHRRITRTQDSTPIRCPVEGCDKVVSSKGNLPVHLDSHKNEKFICEYCSKVFTHLPSLERHIKTHVQGPKTFSCDICGKVLATSSNLLYHKRIHTGEKPAQCEHCGKGFTCPRDLNIHLKRRHQELTVRFTCKLCKQKFKIYGRLRQHFARYHPDHTVEDEKDL